LPAQQPVKERRRLLGPGTGCRLLRARWLQLYKLALDQLAQFRAHLLRLLIDQRRNLRHALPPIDRRDQRPAHQVELHARAGVGAKLGNPGQGGDVLSRPRPELLVALGQRYQPPRVLVQSLHGVLDTGREAERRVGMNRQRVDSGDTG
jgi:hypothetical protein